MSISAPLNGPMTSAIGRFRDPLTLPEAIREVLFNVTSVMTGTGYASDPYDSWGGLPVALFFVIPLIGILIYMIARPKNTEQDQRMMAEAQAAQARLVGGSAVDDIAKAQDLLDKGAISQAEFDALKAKALA